ncbi:hypothetical protein [Streptomyces xiaopingdaonensis]|uniref:hypothetical protein n=1 Tax=Streptomyces xiaopingdaonensis TaxID=1565415 RepID=UPI00031267F9|nr:hypothetical protein [Streptomyces xiaopingdaonensis]
MSLDEELTAAQRCLEDLTRSVNRLERRVGAGLEMRRVRSDTDHLKESLSLLRASSPEPPGAGGPELVLIPEAPYDRELWTDVDDEGLGARDRRAP